MQCFECNASITEESRSRGASGRPRCKPCYNEKRRAYHDTHRPHLREQARIYRAAHPEHRLREMPYHRAKSLAARYGLTMEDYEQMLQDQEGVCLICGNPETAKTRGGGIRPLAVDHDHDSGQLRGLLCHACNAGLGYFRDDVAVMQRAAKYILERSPLLCT